MTTINQKIVKTLRCLLHTVLIYYAYKSKVFGVLNFTSSNVHKMFNHRRKFNRQSH